MKKEEICVLIDTPEKAKKAYKILSDAGEELDNNFYPNHDGHINLFYNEENGWTIGYGVGRNKITLKKLKKFLKTKEFAIPINDKDQYLKVKEVAENMGFKLITTTTTTEWDGNENYVFISEKKYNSCVALKKGTKVKSYSKFVNELPETTKIRVPVKYENALKLVLQHLDKAEKKHPFFVSNNYEFLEVVKEELAEIEKDMINGKCPKSEIADLIAPCIRILSE